MATETVKVMVRVRPFNSSEKQANYKQSVKVIEKQNSLVLFKPNELDSEKQFTFDYVFGIDSQQSDIYDLTASPLIESVVDGYNGTMFAYGQTGCGKTFSMIGDPTSEVHKGIIPRAFQHIVNIISTSQGQKKYLVRCSYLEIYNEEIHDLIGKDSKLRMEMKESADKGVFIKDLSLVVVRTVEEMEKWMNYGNKNRAVGETQMNKDSSRSHSIFTVYVECEDKDDSQKLVAGKLHLVDLAGSERQSKTQASGDRLKEGVKINLSLSALGNVISALADGKTQHIPYRDSKLTRMLQDSLGGNTKTIMIAAVSPADYNFEETLSTLRYASRAKFIKNQPKVNEDPKDALLREYAEEIKKLKEKLQSSSGTVSEISKPPLPKGKQNSNSSPQKQLQRADDLQRDQQANQRELLKLKEVNTEFSKQRELWESQIKQQEERVNQEKVQRERLELLMKEMEQKQIIGGTANDDEKKKFKKAQAKLKRKLREQEKLLEEKKTKEEELICLETNYQTLQEQVDSLRDVIIHLRNKYKQALEEISDLQKEHEENREDLLDTIRFQEQEMKLYKGMVKMLFNNDEISKIKGQSTWSTDKNDYIIVPFYLKEKDLKFPKLPYQQALDIIETEKEVREVQFQKKTKVNESSDLLDDWTIQPKFKESNLSYASGNGKLKYQEPKTSNTKLQPLRYDGIQTDNMSTINVSQSTNNLKRINNNTRLNPLQPLEKATKQYSSDSEQQQFQQQQQAETKERPKKTKKPKLLQVQIEG